MKHFKEIMNTVNEVLDAAIIFLFIAAIGTFLFVVLRYMPRTTQASIPTTNVVLIITNYQRIEHSQNVLLTNQGTLRLIFTNVFGKPFTSSVYVLPSAERR